MARNTEIASINLIEVTGNMNTVVNTGLEEKISSLSICQKIFCGQNSKKVVRSDIINWVRFFIMSLVDDSYKFNVT